MFWRRLLPITISNSHLHLMISQLYIRNFHHSGFHSFPSPAISDCNSLWPDQRHGVIKNSHTHMSWSPINPSTCHNPLQPSHMPWCHDKNFSDVAKIFPFSFVSSVIPWISANQENLFILNVNLNCFFFTSARCSWQNMLHIMTVDVTMDKHPPRWNLLVWPKPPPDCESKLVILIVNRQSIAFHECLGVEGNSFAVQCLFVCYLGQICQLCSPDMRELELAFLCLASIRTLKGTSLRMLLLSRRGRRQLGVQDGIAYQLMGMDGGGGTNKRPPASCRKGHSVRGRWGANGGSLRIEVYLVCEERVKRQ